MKKLIAVTLILVLLMPAAALADYSPHLGMTMEEYLAQYNAIEAPLGSPYQKLTAPYQWTPFNGYRVAWFKPSKDSSVILLLYSNDPAGKNDLTSGLDKIQVCTDNSKDFIDLVSITARVAEPVSADLFGTSISDLRVTQLIRYYYENGYKGSGSYAYWTINEEETVVLAFFEQDGWYYFHISMPEDI